MTLWSYQKNAKFTHFQYVLLHDGGWWISYTSKNSARKYVLFELLDLNTFPILFFFVCTPGWAGRERKIILLLSHWNISSASDPKSQEGNQNLPMSNWSLPPILWCWLFRQTVKNGCANLSCQAIPQLRPCNVRRPCHERIMELICRPFFRWCTT